MKKSAIKNLQIGAQKRFTGLIRPEKSRFYSESNRSLHFDAPKGVFFNILLNHRFRPNRGRAKVWVGRALPGCLPTLNRRPKVIDS